MDNKTLAIIGTTVLTTFMSGQSIAGKGSSFTDYARVISVEPIYKYVIVKKPQRRCEIIRSQPTHRSGHQPNIRRNNNHSNARHHANNNTNSAVFIGGIIGGAIGHHVTRNINGRSNTGATLAGAVIGSSIAHSAARNQSVSHQSDSNRRHHNRHNNSHRRNGHQPSSYERCHTTTVSHEERRHDGYRVTYRYKGHTLTTKTRHDPGQRIAVRVEIKPH